MKRRVIDYQAAQRSPQPPARPPGPAVGTVHLLLRWPIILGALGVASGLVILCLGLAWMSRPAGRPPATARLNIIAAPGLTPPPTETQGGPSTPTGTVFPTPPPGVIALGAFVQVNGTGGAGLRLREAAGLDAKVMLLAGEAEVFRVEDGPQEADGSTWWYLVGPYDDTRRGWGVANYLQAVEP